MKQIQAHEKGKISFSCACVYTCASACVAPVYTYVSCAYACAYAYASVVRVNQALKGVFHDSAHVQAYQLYPFKKRLGYALNG